ncbi:MAG: methyltransferase domain-containing protein [Alphaproteobacteria bacterium]|nr:methyltransferase domain-containing protein [Alphaproteobacteria bacterium]
MTSADREPVIEEYARLAARYDRRWAFYVEATLRETLRRLDPAPGERVLDVGCGTGALLSAMSQIFPGLELVGIDPTPEMLAVARSKLGGSVELVLGAAEDLPFGDSSFDLVISTSMLHYIQRPADALAEMARVLKPGGRLVITDWCDDYLACRICDFFLRKLNPAHFDTYGGDDCRRLMNDAAFEAVEVERFKINWLWGLMTAQGRKPA